MQPRPIEGKHTITEFLDSLVIDLQAKEQRLALASASLLMEDLRWLVTIPNEARRVPGVGPRPGIKFGFSINLTRLLARKILMVLRHITDYKLEAALLECVAARVLWVKEGKKSKGLRGE